jgi:hypothetical protein
MAAANYGNSYKLAERLSEQLDEMGKDLTSMIEEVNGASATLSKTNKADEPVCTFIIVLRRLSFQSVSIVLTNLPRFLKSCASSTRIFLNCSLSTRAHPSSRQRSAPHKSPDIHCHPGLVMDSAALGWAAEVLQMTSIAPTWDGDD